jgi:pyruvate/2-oxoglutarate dehydrogenase complex dihydrolipoamide dehydrogenase (E3) component
VEKMVQRIELDGADSVNRQTNVERAAETAKKVQNVISHLITNEGILVISQDAKVKNDRYLTLNMNLDIETLAGQLQSGAKEIY